MSHLLLKPIQIGFVASDLKISQPGLLKPSVLLHDCQCVSTRIAFNDLSVEQLLVTGNQNADVTKSVIFRL